MPTTQPINLQKEIQTRLAALPQVVRNVIKIAQIQDDLRQLANLHQLHLDQWTELETEVMATLVGLQEVKDIPEHLRGKLHMDAKEADSLAEDISEIVFKPIREALERELGHPQAKEDVGTGVEQVRTEVLRADKSAVVAPATPPAAAPDTKVERAPVASSYISTASHERKEIIGDPYREQP